MHRRDVLRSIFSLVIHGSNNIKTGRTVHGTRFVDRLYICVCRPYVVIKEDNDKLDNLLCICDVTRKYSINCGPFFVVYVFYFLFCMMTNICP